MVVMAAVSTFTSGFNSARAKRAIIDWPHSRTPSRCRAQGRPCPVMGGVRQLSGLPQEERRYHQLPEARAGLFPVQHEWHAAAIWHQGVARDRELCGLHGARASSGMSPPGRGFSKLAAPAVAASDERGEAVFTAKCSACRGADGAGQVIEGGPSYPPPWGPESYNWGAGTATVDKAAAFIRANMPAGHRCDRWAGLHGRIPLGGVC